MTPAPDERDPRSWRGADIHEDLRTGPEIRSVLDRAHATQVPYQYEDEVLLRDEVVTGELRSREYTRARVRYNCGVQRNGRIKLFTHGHFWGGNEDHQRFKAQYRRAPPPTETVPFESYEVWMRYVFGTVERTHDGGVVFEADTDRTGESVRSLEWGALFTPVQRRLAELELVRNPALARYVLEENDEWAEFATALRYDTDAFAVGP